MESSIWCSSKEYAATVGSGRWRIGAGLGLLALALVACAEPEPLALEREVYEVVDGVESLVDEGCTELPDELGGGFGFGFGTAPSGDGVAYSVSYDFDSDSVVVSAGALSGSGLVEREYDEVFLRSGQTDELVVELAEGFALRLVNRGATGCGLSGAAPASALTSSR